MSNHIVFNAQSREWKLAKMSVLIYQQFIDWGKQELPDPFEDVLKLNGKLPKEYLDQLFEEAKQRTRLRGSPKDPDLLALMKTPKGAFKLFQLRLNVHHPEVTAEQAGEIMLSGLEEHGEEKWNQLMEQANNLGGKMPKTERQATDDFFVQKG